MDYYKRYGFSAPETAVSSVAITFERQKPSQKQISQTASVLSILYVHK